MKFPYQRYEVNASPTLPGSVLYRPEVPIRVIGLAGSASFLALADTGADETLLPRSLGEAIGVEFDEPNAWAVTGFGGQELAVVAGEVDLQVTSRRTVHRWRARIGWVSFPNPADKQPYWDTSGSSINSRRSQRIFALTRIGAIATLVIERARMSSSAKEKARILTSAELCVA